MGGKRIATFSFYIYTLTMKSLRKGLALSKSKGFTLIELLVVIAVLGVLAAGVFTAINPLERLAQARDAQKKATIGQLAQAMSAYYTSNLGVYPGSSPTWIQTLVDSGDLKNIPPAAPSPACSGHPGDSGSIYLS